ncbi:YceI family protein [Calidifontibacter sp. DB0510]|uniref:YceI family protein n=1 Tax=Metallococcus carri TaxID=1656884 RepID=A0A967B619_9MICO|nr:YceI family protein [Metallococcus carri]NHN55316.1 YceI family protein [Metallococcus carri]NOP36393.1 polyisoprenoid-binding protein [Calidifontibacter sp. DB2511S]
MTEQTLTSVLPGLTAGTWNADPAHSEIAFTVRHLMVSKVRGKFEDFTVTVNTGEQLADTTVDAVVQMASVNTGVADRDNHLRTNDFFEIDKFPTMTFKATQVTADTLVGDLTIKGITRPVSFDLDFGGVGSDPWGGTRAGFEASTEINRKDFGVTIDMPLEGGGAVVGDKVKILLDIELVKA